MMAQVACTKKEYSRIPMKKRGFTLIELLVSIALLALLLCMVYTFLSASHNFFGLSDRRADAQTQLRMIMAGLKREVSTSEYVQIANNTRTPQNGAEELYYSGTTSTNGYTLLHEVIGNTTVAFSSLPLKEFQITFEYETSRPQILKVTMNTSEGYSLSGEILSPNINITGSATGTKLVLRQAK